MGVRSVNGADPRVVAPAVAVRAPVPRPRSAEAGREAAPPARAHPNPGEEQGQHTASDIVKQASANRAGTRLRVDESSKRVVAQIVDENNEVIKQIPTEEVLEIAARFRELRGKLFDHKV